jgi:hypothetical protein
MSNLNGRTRWQTILAQGVFLGGAMLLTATAAEAPKSAPTAPDPSQKAATNAVAPSPSASAITTDKLKEYAAKPTRPFEGEGWKPMFDGKSLAGWRETQFEGRGTVECRAGVMVLNAGRPFTGVNWTNNFPIMNYEVALDAMLLAGSDFFCGLTVPVTDSCCSLIVGGWGGSLVGISSLDGMDASENETTKFMSFEVGRWYRIRLRVTENKIEAWIDGDKLIDAVTTARRISVRPGDIELSQPVGIAAWETASAIREVKVRRVK